MSKPRYLTASRVSLLVLIELYCSPGFPTVATIPTLSFILSHSITTTPSAARAPRSSHSHNASIPVRMFEQVLQGQPSSMPGRTLLDAFLRQMWELSSLDALFEFFDRLGELLRRPSESTNQDDPAEKMQLSQTSPLGALVRKARVEFVRLHFDDAIRLWSEFITYRAPTQQWTRRLAGLASSGLDTVTTDLGLGLGDPLFDAVYGRLLDGDEAGQIGSMNDTERLLDFQLDRLQKLGCRVPDEMKTQLRSIVEGSGTAPRQAHLVQFFDSWKAGDYTSSFDNLHRYFDYAMQARERVHYQYALLHMAILHADFGCFGEAIAAIHETITTARENQDLHCLNFSLNWLHHMSKAYPKQMKKAGYMSMLGSEREALAFLKAKARETKAYHLLSATLLNEAKVFLLTGDSVARAFEHMYQSSHLNIKENVGTYGPHMLFESAVYSRLGVSTLASAYSELLIDCYSPGCPLDEHVRATCRRAFLSMHRGQYEKALESLRSIDKAAHRILKLHQYIFYCTGLIKLRRAIHWTDWAACEAYLINLKPDDSTDPELSFLLTEASILCSIERGLYYKAFEALEELASSLKDDDADVLQRVSVLVSKADLFRKVGKPERGFSIALRAASVAFRARLMPCLWSAIGMLANILNSMGDYEPAARMLHAVIPQALENADQLLNATLYSHLGDSCIGMAGEIDVSTQSGTRTRAAHVSRAEMYIDRSRECFKRIENLDGECEQLMKKAIIAKLRGDEKLAEEWAQNHNRVWDDGMRRLSDNDGIDES